MDESRKAFESWLMEEFGYRHDYLEYWRGEGEYKSHPDLRSRWQGWSSAWQASRAAIALDMPEPFKLAKSSSGLTYYYQDEVDAVLSVAGIKVKE